MAGAFCSKLIAVRGRQPKGVMGGGDLEPPGQAPVGVAGQIYCGARGWHLTASVRWEWISWDW